MSSVSVYYRRLPHWRRAEATYFVTWRLHPSQGPLQPDERSLVQNALRHFDQTRYSLWAWVVMDDHVHALLTPQGTWLLAQILHSWKSYTAHQLKRGRHVWAREYFDRVIRDDDEFTDTQHYIVNNPLKRWPDVWVYPWVGFRPRR